MKREDIRTLLLFIIIVLLIGLCCLYNDYRNRTLNNIDRKVDVIFNKYSYDLMVEQGQTLFFDTIKFLNSENYGYEEEFGGDIRIYTINDYNRYKKIVNFSVIKDLINSTELANFMNLKKIINYEDEFYIESYKEEINENYIGSIIELMNYDTNFANFKSTNYYCENANYQGLLTNAPNCNYTFTETNYSLNLEGNILKINNIEDIYKIIKKIY